MSKLEIGNVAARILIAASILIATVTYMYEAHEDRLQRQCMLFVEAFGTERLGVIYSVTKPELAMPAAIEGRNTAKSVANFINLTPEHAAYCDTRSLSYKPVSPTN